MYKSIVIGISGATCSGKSTLAEHLHTNIPNSTLICQDNYFLSSDDPRHVIIPELNHANWEILSSLDMKRMEDDIYKIIGDSHIPMSDITLGETYANGQNDVDNLIQRFNADKVKLLIIEGFHIFTYQPIVQLFHLKYFLTLEYDICRERRNNRVYYPPDVPGYFEKVVWPEYEKYRDEVFRNCKNMTILNGSVATKEHYECILKDLAEVFIHNKLLV